MAPSWFQIVLVLLLIVLLFGRGKISDVMGDIAKGIKSFKSGLSEEEEVNKVEPKSIEDRPGETIDAKSHENVRAG